MGSVLSAELDRQSRRAAVNKPEFLVTLADEITQAFRNVERTLVSVGANWEHVIAVNFYRVGFPEDVNQIVTERFRHHMPNHAPIWTALRVAALGDPKMRVEIQVTAIFQSEQPSVAAAGRSRQVKSTGACITGNTEFSGSGSKCPYRRPLDHDPRSSLSTPI